MRKNYFVILVFISLGADAQEFFNEQTLLKNLKILSADSMQGRRTGMPGNLMAAGFIKTQFNNLNIPPIGTSYELPFQFQSKAGLRTGVNLAGVIKGKGVSEKYIVISAHYDHEGMKNETIYNGTDDNASGVSALLAIAEYLKTNPPHHNIVIIAFDAEELGLQGAKAFVQNPPFEVKEIILNLNLDMVARADNNELIACGTFFYPHLKPYIEKVKPVGHVRFRYSNDDPEKYKGKDNWTNSSDHGPFHKAKIPFIYFGVDDHADYHQPTDDFEKVNPGTYISCVKMILNSIIEIDKGLN